MKTHYNGKKKLSQILFFENVWLSISTKLIFKKVFTNYAQNNIVQLPPSNAIVRRNYTLLILNDQIGIFWKINTCTKGLYHFNSILKVPLMWFHKKTFEWGFSFKQTSLCWKKKVCWNFIFI